MRISLEYGQLKCIIKYLRLETRTQKQASTFSLEIYSKYCYFGIYIESGIDPPVKCRQKKMRSSKTTLWPECANKSRLFCKSTEFLRFLLCALSAVEQRSGKLNEILEKGIIAKLQE